MRLTSTHHKHHSIVIALLLLLTFGIQSSHAVERWTDEALLHDGRTIEVNRSVKSNFGQGELSNALQKWPDQYEIEAQNPDDGSIVRWSGERNFAPILLDFWNSAPHLVLVANSVFSELNRYGCPEIPYVFLRYDRSNGRWIQLPATDFPKSLLRANLSFRYDPYYMDGGKRQSKEDIKSVNASSERSSAQHTTSDIPTSFASWRYQYKNQYRVGHGRDGCSHLVPSNKDPSHPQSPGQPSKTMPLEVLDTRIFEPEWVIKGDAKTQAEAWNKIHFDRDRYSKCQALFRRVGDESSKPELRGWLLFVNDPTGTKKARETGGVFCNADALWFADYASDRLAVHLAKFSVEGDFLYRLAFLRPDRPGDYPGGILQATFRDEGGYLYFDWWNTNQYGWDRRVARALKVRVAEPNVAVQGAVAK